MSCINILGIKTFLAIVETNSLAKAAEKLFLSQSTVSYRLNELEQELGIQLIMREQGKRFITLTREGEEFIAIAERWLSLERDTDDWKNKGQDNMYLKIGSVDSLNSYIFPPLFRSIISGDNPFTINVSSHWTFTVYNLLKNYELDLGLVLGIINFSDILSYPVFQEKLVLATYDYSEKFTGKEEISPCTLDPENEIYVNWGTDYVSWHDKWWDPTKRKNLV
ncbi:MAG: LysR family transcriptional regulator, partial [Lachnospiraceae bacterium]|nr:LysR family transcriptional regulator [Lachnospiraceae bacterium]